MITDFVGKYRVIAEYDRSTNDWIRDEYGKIDTSFNDFYIPLENNVGRILSYDKKILIIHIIDNPEIFLKLKNIQKKNPVKGLSIFGNCNDGFIYINEDDLPKYLGVIKPISKGKKIKPFDKSNLPNNLEIPQKEIKTYNLLSKKINKEGNFKLFELSKEFIKNNCNETLENFRKSGFTFSDFIYKIGKWEEYLTFLNKSINNS